MRSSLVTVWLVGFTLISLDTSARAGSLSGLLESPLFRRLELAPIGPALATSVASTYPVASASSSVTYVYNPALETFERATRVAGPIIGERAETIGKGAFNFAASYHYVHLTTINGDDLDQLVNRVMVGGHLIVFPVKGGTTLKDGRYTNFLPVRVVADLDVEAHIFAPSLTYGVTPDFDVNLTVPLVRTALDVTADTEVPDPRLPQFAVPAGPTRGSRSLSDSAFGVGDILLRAKYILRRERPFDVAAGLGLSLPSGDVNNFQGSGTTRVQPTLIFSRIFADRFQPFVNIGMDLNADDAGRSVFRWAVGGTATVVGPLTAALVFLGRDELGAQADKIPRPFFFQIERNDIFDASIGFRWRFTDSGVVALNALVPLNNDGLRPDVIPTVEVEYAF